MDKTSQIPSKMALGRGRLGARGGDKEKMDPQQESRLFALFFVFFVQLQDFYKEKNGHVQKHRKYIPSKNEGPDASWVSKIACYKMLQTSYNILKFRIWQGSFWEAFEVENGPKITTRFFKNQCS